MKLQIWMHQLTYVEEAYISYRISQCCVHSLFLPLVGKKICFRSLEHHLNGSIELLLQHLDKLVDYKAMENSVAKVVVLVFLI